VKNEKALDSEPGAAHSGTEHSVHEAEAQHGKDSGLGTAEKDGDDSCAFEDGAETDRANTMNCQALWCCVGRLDLPLGMSS
jgi:hypothetical protein